MPGIFALAAIAGKFGLYLGILAAAGTVLAARALGLGQYRRQVAGFGALGLLCAILSFAIGGARLSGELSGMADPEMLGLLWQTLPGTVLRFRLLGLGLLLGGVFLGRAGFWLSAPGGVLAVWSFAHVGHVAGSDSLALDAALTLHLLAVAFWIGILMPLLLLARDADTRHVAGQVAHRFGRIASVVVPGLIVAGCYMAYALVGTLDALVGTGYGRAIMLKIALVAMLLGLAAANKLRFVPRLRAGDAAAAGQLGRTITLEWIAIVMILATTAVLTTRLTLPSVAMTGATPAIVLPKDGPASVAATRGAHLRDLRA